MPRISWAGWPLPLLALLCGVLGMSAVWVAAATLSGRSCSWLALVAAVDMALLLRLTRSGTGALPTLSAVVATALTVALSRWLIAATQLGFALGLEPIASSIRLGPALAWQLTQLSLSRLDWIWLLSSLPLAAILSSTAAWSRRAPSDRRPGP